MPAHIKNWRCLAVLMLLCLLQGCSTQFAYNRLDWLISWYMGDYINLDKEQKVLFRQRLDPLLEWHRQEELYAYIQILERIKNELQQDVSPNVISGWVKDVTTAARRVESRLLELMLDIGSDMSDEQVAYFKEKLWKSQDKYKKKYLKRSDATYKRESMQSLAKNLRRFIGKLDDSQEQILQHAIKDIQRFDRVWLEDRQRWLNTIEPLLVRAPGWQHAILVAHSEREKSRSTEYQELYAHNSDIITSAISLIINQRSDKQNARLHKEIDKLRTELGELAAQGSMVKVRDAGPRIDREQVVN